MLNFLIGGGHMAEAILAYGWSESPLGPPEIWDDIGPVRDERGKIVGVLDTVVETAATVRAHQQSDLITRELLTGPVQALPAQGRN